LSWTIVFSTTQRPLIRVPVRSPAPVAESADAKLPIPGEDLVARLARDPELLADPGHGLPVENPGDHPQASSMT
jgi:hypothetical protein